ncbi:hypothetical protein STRCI_005631 [Streptomyces cinnabarinus]|uniref:Uncharacterized protein n=1 Tax=Streptomyces cinnabarinus TaxID=67287 RepID=A0ABY7KMV4_9ACTN|nr:hypothetical protein [Streptomyces cinnabarinus]WAZ24229.1 hypothetical protein STRCI_005631 [Streptomyces cinnabarinus]
MSSYSDTLTPAQAAWPLCDRYASAVEYGDDYLLPPPDPAQRLSTLSATDHRRLDLYAALTVRGIAPLPGDQHAVEAISSLGDGVMNAVLRWVTNPSNC